MRECPKSYNYIGKISNINEEHILWKNWNPNDHTMISFFSSCVQTKKLEKAYIYDFTLGSES